MRNDAITCFHLHPTQSWMSQTPFATHPWPHRVDSESNGPAALAQTPIPESCTERKEKEEIIDWKKNRIEKGEGISTLSQLTSDDSKTSNASHANHKSVPVNPHGNHGVHCTHGQCTFQVSEAWPPTPQRRAAGLATAEAWASAPKEPTRGAAGPAAAATPAAKEGAPRTLPAPPSKAGETIQP